MPSANPILWSRCIMKRHPKAVETSRQERSSSAALVHLVKIGNTTACLAVRLERRGNLAKPREDCSGFNETSSRTMAPASAGCSSGALFRADGDRLEHQHA
jgi:hypothetical protein